MLTIIKDVTDLLLELLDLLLKLVVLHLELLDLLMELLLNHSPVYTTTAAVGSPFLLASPSLPWYSLALASVAPSITIPALHSPSPPWTGGRRALMSCTTVSVYLSPKLF